MTTETFCDEKGLFDFHAEMFMFWWWAKCLFRILRHEKSWNFETGKKYYKSGRLILRKLKIDGGVPISFFKKKLISKSIITVTVTR